MNSAYSAQTVASQLPHLTLGRTRALVWEPLFWAYSLIIVAYVVNFIETFVIYRESFAAWGGQTDVSGDFLCSKIRMVALAYAIFLVLARHGKLIGPVILYLIVLAGLWSWPAIVSYSFDAAISAGMKDTIPVTAILLGLVYRDRLHVLAYSILLFATVNNLAQVFLWPIQVMGVIPAREFVAGSGIVRATGLVDCGGFVALNFAAMVLADRVVAVKHKTRAVAFFAFFGMSALMFRNLPVYLAYLLWFILRRRLSALHVLLGVMLILISTLLFPWLHQSVTERVSRYLDTQDTMRNESYRVMHESLADWNFFGEGLGTFGGPAAYRYKSPLYSRHNVLDTNLLTSDTYYPHLFIESGLIGGLWFLAMPLLPIAVLRPIPGPRIFPYAALVAYMLIECLGGFFFEDMLRCFCVLPLLFPLLSVQSLGESGIARLQAVKNGVATVTRRKSGIQV